MEDIVIIAGDQVERRIVTIRTGVWLKRGGARNEADDVTIAERGWEGACIAAGDRESCHVDLVRTNVSVAEVDLAEACPLYKLAS